MDEEIDRRLKELEKLQPSVVQSLDGRVKDLEKWQSRLITVGATAGVCILAFLGVEKWSAIPAAVNDSARSEIQQKLGPEVARQIGEKVKPEVVAKINEAEKASDAVIALQNAETSFTVSLNERNALTRGGMHSCFIETGSDAPAVGSFPGYANIASVGALFVATLQQKDTGKWGVYVRVDMTPVSGKEWSVDVNVIQPKTSRTKIPAPIPYAPRADY